MSSPARHSLVGMGPPSAPSAAGNPAPPPSAARTGSPTPSPSPCRRSTSSTVPLKSENGPSVISTTWPIMKGISSFGSASLDRLGDAEQPVDFFLAQRLRQLPGADELDHALDAVDDVQRFLAHHHLDQHVAREQLPLDVDLLAVLDLDHFLDRHQRLTDQLLLRRPRILLDPPLEQLPDLVLVPGRRLNRVPAISMALPRERARPIHEDQLEQPVHEADRDRPARGQR